MQGDEAELTAAVRAAQEGDESAFRTVYRSVHPRLLGYVRTLVPDPDAEDVASEAWLQIARDLSRFEGDADRFRGWAARIARNRALDHLRMRGRRPAVGGDESELAGMPAGADTADEALEALGTGRTMALISRLPRDQAEAVVLRVVVGLDAKSAAEVLGKRSGAVRTAAHRGLRKLAEMLEPPATDGAHSSGLPCDPGAGGPAGTGGRPGTGPRGSNGPRGSTGPRGSNGPRGGSGTADAVEAPGGTGGSGTAGNPPGPTQDSGQGSTAGAERPRPGGTAREGRTRGMARGVTHHGTRTLRET
ncbi:RNA polymerase sigma factor [Streptomyces sp. NRRL F-5053]|uniref:RNA polymerase sigma factor n=1 Tax=Streptomyces sp. NRRL F-5053 TaxID=1463854 RepID=UPI00056B9245|nr:RNA polymerase sigma factor [Streptomyces sp. NRRL F-5053]